MNLTRFSVATFNLYNLQDANRPIYQGRPWTDAEFAAKADWISRQLATLDADIVGLQELWSKTALEQVLATGHLDQVYDMVADPAASSLVEAGQWAMLVDPYRALELWRRAGWLYRDLDFGFGYYLSVITGVGRTVPDVDERLMDDLRSHVRDLAIVSRVAHRDPGVRSEIGQLPEPMRHPQQQAYLVLAGATIAWPNRTKDFMESLSALVDNSPHRYGVTPVGASSTPISALWDVAGRFMRRERDDVPEWS